MTTLLTPDVEAFIGHVVTYVAPEPLGRASIRYFVTAIGADPDRWVDEAPPTLVCETTQLTGRTEPDADGYLGHTWNLPLPEPCTMIRGGNDYRFHRPVRPDDRITTTWTLTAMTERRDRDGAPMLIVTARADYGDEHADPIASNIETLIYRPDRP